MAAFNEVDGLPCHINPWLLQTVLRERLGFNGLLVGDYQGLNLGPLVPEDWGPVMLMSEKWHWIQAFN